MKKMYLLNLQYVCLLTSQDILPVKVFCKINQKDWMSCGAISLLETYREIEAEGRKDMVKI